MFTYAQLLRHTAAKVEGDQMTSPAVRRPWQHHPHGASIANTKKMETYKGMEVSSKDP